MARGQDTSKHPSRQVGRVNLFGLGDRGNIKITWEGGDTEAVPFKELRHAPESPDLQGLEGKKLTKKHLKEVAGNWNTGNTFSSPDVTVYRDR